MKQNSTSIHFIKTLGIQLCLFLCFSFSLQAQYILKGDEASSPFSIHTQATFVDVGSKQLTFEEVRNSKTLSLHSQYVLKGNDVSPFSIHSQATYVDVGSKELTLEEVRSSKSLTFIPVQQANADFGFTKNHFWIKFQLKNDSDAEVLYFLETARPITDFAELYCL